MKIMKQIEFIDKQQKLDEMQEKQKKIDKQKGKDEFVIIANDHDKVSSGENTDKEHKPVT